jgi:Trk-type K+ transport systems, membrane components
MNYKLLGYIMGQVAALTAALLLVPFFIAVGGGEDKTPLAFGITIFILLAAGVPLILKRPDDVQLSARGGFIIVALSWILLSLIGALPFTISGYIPSYLDSVFETVSGFTTTGATILSNVEVLPQSLLFWRSFTHWIGGMGVLVFVIAVLPKSNVAVVHLAKAEIPGPTFGKLVSKLKNTAVILYLIYIVLTLILTLLLYIGKMPLFDCFIHAFGTAGTGGFSNKNLSIGYYNSLYIDIVITTFMFLFSINFNLFFLLLAGNFKQAFKSEELRWHVSYMFGATAIITISLMANNVYTFGMALRRASFQVASIGSTTGYATADFASWPIVAQMVLFVCMFIGGMAGSTAGGIKVSRILILSKANIRAIKRSISPRLISNIKVDNRPIDEPLVANVMSYAVVFTFIFFASIILVAIGGNETDGAAFTTYVTAVAACINNVGPGLNVVGPMGNFGGLSAFSKIVLIFDMLVGRLEVMPLLLLFYPKSWKAV